jgi:acyl carrier protein
VQVLNEILHEADPAKLGAVRLETLLESNDKLPLDSLATFELATLIEERLGVEIKDEELPSMAFPQKLVEMIVSRASLN